MSDGHKFVEMMRQAGRTPQNEVVDLIEGTVTAVNPLKVKVDNRELTETFLIQGALVTETHIYTDNIKKFVHEHSVPTINTQPAGEGPHSHSVPQRDSQNDFISPTVDIMLWRGLKVGDVVYMLKLGRGQKYFILQRREGVKST